MLILYIYAALDGFELAVVDYLVKPFSLERFLKATQKAFELKQLKDGKAAPSTAATDHFFVKCDGRLIKVIYDDLLYVEAMANYVVLHTTTDKLIAYLTIKGILEKLPSPQFMQVHKSFIVNTARVNTIDGNTLHLGDARISMSAGYADGVMGYLLKDKLFKR